MEIIPRNEKKVKDQIIESIKEMTPTVHDIPAIYDSSQPTPQPQEIKQKKDTKGQK